MGNNCECSRTANSGRAEPGKTAPIQRKSLNQPPMFSQIGSSSKLFRINDSLVKKTDTAADRSAHPHAVASNKIISHRQYGKVVSI